MLIDLVIYKYNCALDYSDSLFYSLTQHYTCQKQLRRCQRVQRIDFARG